MPASPPNLVKFYAAAPSDIYSVIFKKQRFLAYCGLRIRYTGKFTEKNSIYPQITDSQSACPLESGLFIEIPELQSDTSAAADATFHEAEAL